MLSTIKSIINNKEELLESTAYIYEDIIDDIENYITEDVDDDSNKENDMDEDSGDEDSGDDAIDSMSLDDSDEEPIVDEESTDPEIDNFDDFDLDDVVEPTNSIDEPEGELNTSNLDGLDDVSLDEDLGDITNVELNTSTNNVADILPVPPMNASDAVVSDTMGTKIDDGFDNTPVVNSTMESFDNVFDDGFDDMNLFNEAIVIDASEDETPDESKPEVVDEPTTDDKENKVTSAVLDKVNEVGTDTTPEKDSKDKLLDKLDKLDRGILDLKENIKKHMS